MSAIRRTAATTSRRKSGCSAARRRCANSTPRKTVPCLAKATWTSKRCAPPWTISITGAGDPDRRRSAGWRRSARELPEEPRLPARHLPEERLITGASGRHSDNLLQTVKRQLAAREEHLPCPPKSVLRIQSQRMRIPGEDIQPDATGATRTGLVPGRNPTTDRPARASASPGRAQFDAHPCLCPGAGQAIDWYSTGWIVLDKQPPHSSPPRESRKAFPLARPARRSPDLDKPHPTVAPRRREGARRIPASCQTRRGRRRIGRIR